jgi:hypothetical protein
LNVAGSRFQISGHERAGAVVKRFLLSAVMLVTLIVPAHAIISLDSKVLNKSVVFFFDADASGNIITTKQDATGFLVMVPDKNRSQQYPPTGDGTACGRPGLGRVFFVKSCSTVPSG